MFETFSITFPRTGDGLFGDGVAGTAEGITNSKSWMII